MATDEQVRFTLDTGHANICGCLFEMLDGVHDRLAFTHLHDNNSVTDQHLVPGNGTIDWQGFVHYLNRCGCTGPLDFELPEEYDFPHAIAMLEAMS